MLHTLLHTAGNATDYSTGGALSPMSPVRLALYELHKRFEFFPAWRVGLGGVLLGGLWLAFWVTTDDPLAPSPAALTAATVIPPSAPPVAAPKPPTPQPTRRKEYGYTILDYGAVPWDYVITVPPPPRSIPLVVTRKDGAIGTLSRIVLDYFGHTSLTRKVYRYDKKYQKMLYDDVRAVEIQQALVLHCEYTSRDQNLVYVRNYWFQTVPHGVEEARLSHRVPNHPILAIQPPRDTCPGTYEGRL